MKREGFANKGGMNARLASISSRTGGGTAYVMVMSGTICIVQFVACDRCFLIDYNC